MFQKLPKKFEKAGLLSTGFFPAISPAQSYLLVLISGKAFLRHAQLQVALFFRFQITYMQFFFVKAWLWRRDKWCEALMRRYQGLPSFHILCVGLVSIVLTVKIPGEVFFYSWEGTRGVKYTIEQIAEGVKMNFSELSMILDIRCIELVELYAIPDIRCSSDFTLLRGDNWWVSILKKKKVHWIR